MASFTMHNDQCEVTVDEHASEIHSFKDIKENREYMWQADPAYWTGRNPTLFPMVGSTYDKKLHIKGKEYAIGNHGFTRHSDFTCVEHDDSHIKMQLKDNEETLAQYPYHFVLTITYTLKERTVSIHYEITNTNKETMPFNFGLHPAFNCPSDPSKKFEDYKLVFNAPEDIHWLTTNKDQVTGLALDRPALKDTIIIHNPKSTEASLTDGTHGVTVLFKGYPWLAFWSPKAPFVCIEPWFGHTDFTEVKVPFEEREGTLFLEAGKTWTADYAIRIQ